MNKELVKEKINWYCDRLHIEKPVIWNYDTVKNVSKIINKKMESLPILICDKCLKVDISYGHECTGDRLLNPTQEY